MLAVAAVANAVAQLCPKLLDINAKRDDGPREFMESKAKLRQVQDFIERRLRKGYSKTQLGSTAASANHLAELYTEAAQARRNHLQNVEDMSAGRLPSCWGVLAMKWTAGRYSDALDAAQQAINVEMSVVQAEDPAPHSPKPTIGDLGRHVFQAAMLQDVSATDQGERPAQPRATPEGCRPWPPFKVGHTVEVLSSSAGWCHAHIDRIERRSDGIQLTVTYVASGGKKQVPDHPQYVRPLVESLGTSCRVGDAVEYFSYNKKAWFPSEVLAVHRDGRGIVAKLDLKDIKNNVDARHVFKRV